MWLACPPYLPFRSGSQHPGCISALYRNLNKGCGRSFKHSVLRPSRENSLIIIVNVFFSGLLLRFSLDDRRACWKLSRLFSPDPCTLLSTHWRLREICVGQTGDTPVYRFRWVRLYLIDQCFVHRVLISHKCWLLLKRWVWHAAVKIFIKMCVSSENATCISSPHIIGMGVYGWCMLWIDISSKFSWSVFLLRSQSLPAFSLDSIFLFGTNCHKGNVKRPLYLTCVLQLALIVSGTSNVDMFGSVIRKLIFLNSTIPKAGMFKTVV